VPPRNCAYGHTPLHPTTDNPRVRKRLAQFFFVPRLLERRWLNMSLLRYGLVHFNTELVQASLSNEKVWIDSVTLENAARRCRSRVQPPLTIDVHRVFNKDKRCKRDIVI
jgi:ribosomal 50S subunit-recycling heat shock protein